MPTLGAMYSPWMLSEFTTVKLILQIEAFVHKSTVNWLTYFPGDPQLYPGLAPVKIPLILFEDVDCYGVSPSGRSRRIDRILPGYSIVP
ncbi:hypothetical protein FS749_005403 [Ceratobasidium sp. UAMH 11750]|nr:hypothetical protein FS749_005403 [Ceratobasidium sp. UAMH 11750]